MQGVLKLIMSSGALSKLPDELQFQIRTLLPRKDHAPIAAAAAASAPSLPPPAPAAPALPQMAPTNMLTAGMQLPFMPLVPQVEIRLLCYSIILAAPSVDIIHAEKSLCHGLS